MVDRIRRVFNGFITGTPSGTRSDLASESSPFADPDSMLTFSEASTHDDLSHGIPLKPLLFANAALTNKSDIEKESLLDRSFSHPGSHSETMTRANKVQSFSPYADSKKKEPRKSVSVVELGNLPRNFSANYDKNSDVTLINQSTTDNLPDITADSNGHVYVSGKATTTSAFVNGAMDPGCSSYTVSTAYFSDGVRQIDYVLAYEDEGDDDSDGDENDSIIGDDSIHNDIEKNYENTDGTAAKKKEKKSDKRRIYEENLERLGLELERVDNSQMGVKFVLVHAPFKVLCKQAELMRIKMPVYANDAKKQNNTLMDGILNKFLKKFKFLEFGEGVQKRMDSHDFFSQPFIEQHLDCFFNHENPHNFFPRTERSRMVYDFLIRTRYDRAISDKFRAGIERLLRSGTYSAAYPLHDHIEYYNKPDLIQCSDRQLLYECWVKMRNFYKYQPLHLIQKYFGTKVGLYFAWLGYYTRFLYFISIIGVLCVVYGVTTMNTDIPSNDICSPNGIGSSVLICPSCDEYCDYTPLNGSCVYAKLTYVFDNTATIFFAAMMSIWATLFLEGWKRYHAEVAYKWNIHDLETEDEVMRPEFQFRIRKRRVNPATQAYEPYLPIWVKIFRLLGSGMTVLFFLCLVIALVIGVIVYRAIVMQVFYAMEGNEFIQSKALIVTSVTAASLNLICILILNYFYNMLALKLTDWECPRTQTEFENSYTLKVFLFQFINFYSSLFYIAFIKGRLSGIPGNTDVTGHRITIDGYRLEECDPAGCMFELVVQLIVIMCGKQFFNSFMETCYPIVISWFRRWHIRFFESKKQKKLREKSQMQIDAVQKHEGAAPLFECDYVLTGTSEQFLFDEYLEMVIQFGFVTLFVAAFPLAPLFALINNIMEIRLDAYKFIVNTRKPMPAQARNIGIWMTILDILSNLAVICNGFVIAFTSDFIPKLYYYFTRYTMEGYVNFSLSYFDSSELKIHQTDYPGTTTCRFRDFREPPCNAVESPGCNSGYGYSAEYWVIMTFRLVFVLVFEHVVLSIKSIFAYMIPDVPTKIVVQIQRERYLARQAILQRQDRLSPQQASPDDDDDVIHHDYTDVVPADNESIALQPNQPLDGGSEQPPPELANIVSRLSRRPSTSSRASQTPAVEQDRPHAAAGPRFRAAILNHSRSIREEDANLDAILNDISDQTSLDSFHTCAPGSTYNLAQQDK